MIDLPICSTVYDTSCTGKSPTKYCLNKNGDGMIYGVDETGNECTLVDEGIYVFSVISDSSATLVTANSKDIIEDSLIIYQCSSYVDEQNITSKKCVKTSGYIYVDSNYYSIPATEHRVSRKVNISTLKNTCYENTEVGSLINFNGEIGVCLKTFYRILATFPTTTDDEDKVYLLIGDSSIVKNGPFYGDNTSKSNNSGIAISSLYQVGSKNPTILYFNQFYTGICYFIT